MKVSDAIKALQELDANEEVIFSALSRAAVEENYAEIFHARGFVLTDDVWVELNSSYADDVNSEFTCSVSEIAKNIIQDNM